MAIRPKGFFGYEEDEEIDPTLADRFYPKHDPANVEAAKKLMGDLAPKPSAAKTSAPTFAPDEDEDAGIIEGRKSDALRTGAGRVSDALYAATTHSPVNFKNRAVHGEADAKADLLKDPSSAANQRYRAYLKSDPDAWQIFQHMDPAQFEQITQSDDSHFDPRKWNTSVARVKPEDPLLEEKRRLLAAQAAKARRPPTDKPSPYIVVTGKGGEQYFANPRDPKATPLPIQDPGGEQMLKPGNDPRELDAVGYTRGPDAPLIKQTEAEKFRSATETQAETQGKIDQMRGLIQKHGSEMYGDVAATMGTLATDMELQVKTLAQLGVLSASDVVMINRIVPNPTGMGGAMKSTSAMLAQLAQFEKMINDKVNAKAHALGYQRAATSANGVDLGSEDGLTPEEQAFIKEYEAKNGGAR